MPASTRKKQKPQACNTRESFKLHESSGLCGGGNGSREEAKGLTARFPTTQNILHIEIAQRAKTPRRQEEIEGAGVRVHVTSGVFLASWRLGPLATGFLKSAARIE